MAKKNGFDVLKNALKNKEIKKSMKHVEVMNREFGMMLGEFKEFRGEMREFKENTEDDMKEIKTKIDKLPCDRHTQRMIELNNKIDDNKKYIDEKKEHRKDWLKGYVFPVLVGATIVVVTILLTKLWGL